MDSKGEDFLGTRGERNGAPGEWGLAVWDAQVPELQFHVVLSEPKDLSASVLFNCQCLPPMRSVPTGVIERDSSRRDNTVDVGMG